MKIIFLLFFPFLSYSQTINDLKRYEKQHQDCLDSGIDMYGCSVRFYSLSDSLLNLIYKKQYIKLDSTQKLTLKTNQRTWLKKRDNEFKKIQKENQNPDLSEVMNGMIIYDLKANFVLDRVRFLIDYK
jgi:uncharacterized protein YecT (DUF1311 family)